MDVKELREKLLQFKNITEKLIEDVEKEKDENIDQLFLERQKIINDIDNLNYAKEIFREIAKSISLLEVSNRLETTIYNKRNELKEKMSNLKNNESANRKYRNNSRSLNNLFNTRI